MANHFRTNAYKIRHKPKLEILYLQKVVYSVENDRKKVH